MLKTKAMETKNTVIILLIFCLSTTHLLAQKRMKILDRDTLYFKSASGFLVPSDSSEAGGYGLVDSFNVNVHTKKIMYMGINQTMIEYECYDEDFPNIDAVAMPVFSVRHGKYSEWYENGAKRVAGFYSNDSLVGDFIVYHKNGKIRRVEKQKSEFGRTIEYFDEKGNETSDHFYYRTHEPLLRFSELSKWISTEMKYPEYARKNKIEGTVYVEFLVNLDGSLYDKIVLKGVEKHLDEEAFRILETMPRWRPGLYATHGKRFKIILPIKFTLKY